MNSIKNKRKQTKKNPVKTNYNKPPSKPPQSMQVHVSNKKGVPAPPPPPPPPPPPSVPKAIPTPAKPPKKPKPPPPKEENNLIQGSGKNFLQNALSQAIWIRR